MNLVGIVGTNSERSTNRKLLRFMAEHFAPQAAIEVLEIKDLPAFDEPENKTAPAAVTAFSKRLQRQMVLLLQHLNIIILFLPPWARL